MDFGEDGGVGVEQAQHENVVRFSFPASMASSAEGDVFDEHRDSLSSSCDGNFGSVGSLASTSRKKMMPGARRTYASSPSPSSPASSVLSTLSVASSSRLILPVPSCKSAVKDIFESKGNRRRRVKKRRRDESSFYSSTSCSSTVTLSALSQDSIESFHEDGENPPGKEERSDVRLRVGVGNNTGNVWAAQDAGSYMFDFDDCLYLCDTVKSALNSTQVAHAPKIDSKTSDDSECNASVRHTNSSAAAACELARMLSSSRQLDALRRNEKALAALLDAVACAPDVKPFEQCESIFRKWCDNKDIHNGGECRCCGRCECGEALPDYLQEPAVLAAARHSGQDRDDSIWDWESEEEDVDFGFSAARGTTLTNRIGKKGSFSASSSSGKYSCHLKRAKTRSGRRAAIAAASVSLTSAKQSKSPSFCHQMRGKIQGDEMSGDLGIAKNPVSTPSLAGSVTANNTASSAAEHDSIAALALAAVAFYLSSPGDDGRTRATILRHTRAVLGLARLLRFDVTVRNGCQNANCATIGEHDEVLREPSEAIEPVGENRKRRARRRLIMTTTSERISQGQTERDVDGRESFGGEGVDDFGENCFSSESQETVDTAGDICSSQESAVANCSEERVDVSADNCNGQESLASAELSQHENCFDDESSCASSVESEGSTEHFTRQDGRMGNLDPAAMGRTKRMSKRRKRSGVGRGDGEGRGRGTLNPIDENQPLNHAGHKGVWIDLKSEKKGEIGASRDSAMSSKLSFSTLSQGSCNGSLGKRTRKKRSKKGTDRQLTSAMLYNKLENVMRCIQKTLIGVTRNRKVLAGAGCSCPLHSQGGCKEDEGVYLTSGDLALFALKRVITGRNCSLDGCDDDENGDAILAEASDQQLVMNDPLYVNESLHASGSISHLSAVLQEIVSGIVRVLCPLNGIPPTSFKHDCEKYVLLLHSRFNIIISIVDGACCLCPDNQRMLCEGTGVVDSLTRLIAACIVRSGSMLWMSKNEDQVGIAHLENKGSLAARKELPADCILLALSALTSLSHENIVAGEQLCVRRWWCSPFSREEQTDSLSSSGVSLVLDVLQKLVHHQQSKSKAESASDVIQKCGASIAKSKERFQYDACIYCLNILTNTVEVAKAARREFLGKNLCNELRTSNGKDLDETRRRHSFKRAGRIPALRWLSSWIVSETDSFRENLITGSFGEKDTLNELPCETEENDLSKCEQESLVMAGNGCVLLAWLMKATDEGDEKIVTKEIRRSILMEMPHAENGNGGVSYIIRTLKAFLNFYHYSVGALSLALFPPVVKLIAELEQM